MSQEQSEPNTSREAEGQTCFVSTRLVIFPHARWRDGCANLRRHAGDANMARLMARFAGRALISGVVGVCLCAVTSTAHAQADLGRFERQLEQIQRETLIEANRDLSLDQRLFFDYGGYATFGYLSVDDNVNENHVLRQYE